MSTETAARGEHAVPPSEAGAGSWLDATGARVSSPRPRRRLPRAVLGVLLVVACVGGAVWWAGASGERVAVLAVARPVSLGHALTEADLRPVELSAGPGVAVVPADQAAGVVGRPAATHLGAGALLTPDALGPAAIPGPGRAVVAIAAAPGRFPPLVDAGAPVTVLVTAAPSPTGTATADTDTASVDSAESTSWRATVVDLAQTSGQQSTVLSLELDATAAVEVARVSPDRLAVVAQPIEGGR